VNTQHAIVRRAGDLAYVPARVPTGFHYSTWRYTAQPQPVLRIWFRNRGNVQITFVVARQTGVCGDGKEKTFQLAGNKVFWMQTADEQRAWRCVAGAQGAQIRLEATTAVPPTRFSDSGLGGVASAGHRIR
jgi:hypothetical protein